MTDVHKLRKCLICNMSQMCGRDEKLFCFYFFLVNHRAFAAALAICFRLLADKLFALALPPFNPPSLPNATAAGFFSGAAETGVCPMDCWTMLKAVSFRSLLERLGMANHCPCRGNIQAKSQISGSKLYHYR